MDCSLPGSTVQGLFQARILEWIVISYSRSFPPRDQTLVACFSYTGLPLWLRWLLLWLRLWLAMWETWVWWLGWEGSLEESMQPTPLFFPGESPSTRNLKDYSPWGREESDTTERSILGNPLAHKTKLWEPNICFRRQRSVGRFQRFSIKSHGETSMALKHDYASCVLPCCFLSGATKYLYINWENSIKFECIRSTSLRSLIFLTPNSKKKKFLKKKSIRVGGNRYSRRKEQLLKRFMQQNWNINSLTTWLVVVIEIDQSVPTRQWHGSLI